MDNRRIAVFCGSNDGVDDTFRNSAKALAEKLSEEKYTLVYGGGSRGLMGTIAMEMKKGGSRLVGITPKRFLASNEKHPMENDEYYVVETLADRKRMMAEMADGFVVFPGGMGTLDELSEMAVTNTLYGMEKPIVILNLNGFFDGLKKLLEEMEKTGFLKNRGGIVFASIPEEVAAILQTRL